MLNLYSSGSIEMNWVAIKKYTIRPITISIIASFIVSLTVTGMDWSLNPGNLFYNNGHIQWNIVLQTFSSWFFPLFAVTSLCFILALFLYSKIANYLRIPKR